MRSTSRGSRAFIVLGACVVAFAACGGNGGDTGSTSVTPTSSTSPSASGPPILEVAASVPVGGEPIGIVAAFGSVWVVNSEFDSGGVPSLSRIDPATATVEATIPVGAVPLEVAEGFGLDSVQRIDPGTNEPQPPITAEALPDGLLAQGDALWVATDLGPILQRLDPAAGEITGTWVVSDQGAINANQLVAEAGGAFWFPLIDAGEVLKVGVPD